MINDKFSDQNKRMFVPRTSSIASGTTDDTGISSVSPNSAFEPLTHSQDAAFHPHSRRFMPRNDPPPVPPKHNQSVNYSAESSLRNFLPTAAHHHQKALNLSRSFSCEKYSSSDPIASEHGRDWVFNSNETSQISSNSFLPSISNSDSSGINPDMKPELSSGPHSFDVNSMRKRDLQNSGVYDPRPSSDRGLNNLASKISRQMEKFFKKMAPKSRSKSSVPVTACESPPPPPLRMLPPDNRSRTLTQQPGPRTSFFERRNYAHKSGTGGGGSYSDQMLIRPPTSPNRPLPETPDGFVRHQSQASSNAGSSMALMSDMPPQMHHVYHHIVHHHVLHHMAPPNEDPAGPSSACWSSKNAQILVGQSLSAEMGTREMLRGRDSGNPVLLPFYLVNPQTRNVAVPVPNTSYSAEAVLVPNQQSMMQPPSNQGSSLLLDRVEHSKTLSSDLTSVIVEPPNIEPQKSIPQHFYSFYEQRDQALTNSGFEPISLGAGSSKPSGTPSTVSARTKSSETGQRSQAPCCSSTAVDADLGMNGGSSPPPPPEQTRLRTESDDDLQAENLRQLHQMGWYWGPLDYRDAERLLHGREAGTFLVRDSGGCLNKLSLSFCAQSSIYHTRIEQRDGVFKFASQPTSVSGRTIVEFIERAVMFNESGSFHFFIQSPQLGSPAISVALVHPLSRKQVVPRLKHLCRFHIRQNVPQTSLGLLPLPAGLTGYLAEPQYFVESVPEMANSLRHLPSLRFNYQDASGGRSSSRTPVGPET